MAAADLLGCAVASHPHRPRTCARLYEPTRAVHLAPPPQRKQSAVSYLGRDFHLGGLAREEHLVMQAQQVRRRGKVKGLQAASELDLGETGTPAGQGTNTTSGHAAWRHGDPTEVARLL